MQFNAVAVALKSWIAMIRKPLKQTANSAFKHLRLLQHNDKTMTGRCQHSDVKSKKVWMDAQFEMPETGKLNNSGRKKEQLHPGRWSCCNPSIFMVSLSVGKALFCKCSGHASLLGVIVRVIVRRKSNFLSSSWRFDCFYMRYLKEDSIMEILNIVFSALNLLATVVIGVINVTWMISRDVFRDKPRAKHYSKK